MARVYDISGKKEIWLVMQSRKKNASPYLRLQ